MDPACGSGGFLLHAMDWCYPATDNDLRYRRKHDYAAKYLWGIDFEARAAKTSRALMLIAGDGHTNIFGPDVSSLNPETWFKTISGRELMHGLRKENLTANRIPDIDAFGDDDKAWDYFDELKFDLILANPPFAGEMKDRRMLTHYELAKPALKRAGDDKQPKEERDVLFIERILKMLKPGGRAAIVLPQGKFNNSSLAFIREWVLKKARLLAVVGLHPNTFKPHTGTKTSVLFIQKYTLQQLADIAKVHDEVATACPDYETNIQQLLDTHAAEIPEELIPEAIADLLAETFAEPETEELAETNGDDESGDTVDVQEPFSDEDRIEQAEEKLEALKAELFYTKQKLLDLTSDSEALVQQQQIELAVTQQQHQAELEAIQVTWTGKAVELTAYNKPKKAEHKQAIQDIKGEYNAKLKISKDRQKAADKSLKAEQKRLEKLIPQVERELKLLTLRGKLELVLADADLIGTLKERWIASEVAKRLDYPIFMAVSERGGKNNSGDYEYMLNEDGSLDYFDLKHSQGGQPKINQDLVNYDLAADDLADAAKIPDEQLCIAEAFVRFAQQQGLGFWGAE